VISAMRGKQFIYAEPSPAAGAAADAMPEPISD
jgi:hypothetical protein